VHKLISCSPRKVQHLFVEASVATAAQLGVARRVPSPSDGFDPVDAAVARLRTFEVSRDAPRPQG